MLSTKVRVSRARTVVAPVAVPKRRDPRFDNLSGAVDQEAFDKEYGFVKELQKQEIEQLEKLAREAKDPLEQDRLWAELRQKKQFARDLEQRSQQHELRTRVKAKKRKLRETGGPVCWRRWWWWLSSFISALSLCLFQKVNLKRSEQKDLELEERYRMLEEKGELDAYLGRKKKKNQQRNKKAIPISRRV